MIDILKVLGRIFLIAFGLSCIGVGGLCTAIGMESSGAGWMATIGLLSLLFGIFMVWQTFRSWKSDKGGRT